MRTKRHKRESVLVRDLLPCVSFLNRQILQLVLYTKNVHSVIDLERLSNPLGYTVPPFVVA